MIGRRAFVASAVGLTMLPANAPALSEGRGMHGLISKMRAVARQRDALIAILLEGTCAPLPKQKVWTRA
jgi:hypothetical protein